jgi:hypothetical protein
VVEVDPSPEDSCDPVKISEESKNGLRGENLKEVSGKNHKEEKGEEKNSGSFPIGSVFHLREEVRESSYPHGKDKEGGEKDMEGLADFQERMGRGQRIFLG